MLRKVFSISIFISIVFFVLYSQPIISAIAHTGFVLGIPSALVYIVAVWIMLIVLLMWITSKKQYTEK